MDYYSPLKVFHHRDRLDALGRGEHPPPVHIHLVPTNRCNQRCRFCSYRAKGYTSSQWFRQNDEIPIEKFREIFDDADRLGVKAIEMTGGGEPTVHRQFDEMCSRLVQRVNTCDFSLVTNGVNLSDERLQLLAAAKWVRFSIDAGTPETYAAVRRVKPETFDRVRENIRKLVALRSGPEPVVGVGFVVTADNWEEVLQATRSAEEDGADNIRISAVFQSEGADYFRNFYASVKNFCRRAGRLENGTFRVFDLFGDRLDDLAQRSPSYSQCGVQRFVTYLGADLNLYRCCVLAYNERGLLGSIRDQSLYDLWQSDELQERLNDFDARGCPRCMFNNKNRTIAYAMNPDPGHINFL